MRNKNLILIFSLLAALCCIAAFLSQFYLNLGFVFSDDPEDWAQFGDYFGGIINPTLSFFAIVLLLRSIDEQQTANNALIKDLENSEKNKKIEKFENLLFNMLDRQNSLLSSIFVDLQENNNKLRIQGIDVLHKLEDFVCEMLDANKEKKDISQAINEFDTHDTIYSQFRCFYLAVTFISDYLGDDDVFNKSERYSYYKTLINFTDFTQIKIMSIYIKYMDEEYENVNIIRNNEEFKEVFVSCGLSFDLY